MKVSVMQKLAEAMKDIAPVMEKHGFLVVGIEDCGNSSWDYMSLKILPKPEPGSDKGMILRKEGIIQ